MKESGEEMWFGLKNQGSPFWGRTYLSGRNSRLRPGEFEWNSNLKQNLKQC